MRKRYYYLRVPMGIVVLDRVSRTWSLCTGRIVLDYGRMRDTTWTRYLPGRAIAQVGR
jgi:hypothetical protein